MRALELHESLARTAVAKKGGGIVNLRPVREPICDFLAYCCENETDPGRFAHLDGYIRSRLPEWKASDRRLAMALRMQRLHPESEVASKVLRAVQDARASSRPGEDAAGGGGNIPTTGGAQQDDVSDTEVVPPYVPPPPGSEFRS